MSEPFFLVTLEPRFMWFRYAPNHEWILRRAKHHSKRRPKLARKLRAIYESIVVVRVHWDPDKVLAVTEEVWRASQ